VPEEDIDLVRDPDRTLHFAYAATALSIATVLAVPTTVVAERLTPCGDCGTTLFGSVCSGSGYGTCDQAVAAFAAATVLVGGMCVLFSLHASALTRARMGRGTGSAQTTSSARAAAQVASLATLVLAAELVLVAALMPILAFCIDSCPAPYSLAGVPGTLAEVSGVVAGAGALAWALSLRRRRPRPLNTVPGW
jgi:hypothetical protein